MHPSSKRIGQIGWSRRWVLVSLAAIVFVAGGCKIARETVRLPGQMMAAVVPGTRSSLPDPAQLQSEVLRYADQFSGRTTAALDVYARRVDTPQARRDALAWKLAFNSASVVIATGPNPTASLLDFLSLSTVMRAFLEERVRQFNPPGALDPWLEISRSLETNAWLLAGQVLTTNQQAEFRVTLEEWCAQNSKVSASFFERPQEFGPVIRQGHSEENRSPESVFALVGLDPTSGLDPAVREVTRARLFAERAMYAFQRMPDLVRWQTELLTDRLLQHESMNAALESADRMSRAAESASQTAAALPDRITAERKAILEALDVQEGRLRELSAEVGRTLVAGERMSGSFNATLVTFDALMKRLGVGEPTTGPNDSSSPPFNILDYARTAEQIATMAQQLDLLIKNASGTMDTPALDRRIADLASLSARARADAKSVLNHAFLLLAGTVILAFACAMFYRRMGRMNFEKP